MLIVLVTLLVCLAVVTVAVWGISKLPLTQHWRTICVIAVVIVVIAWLVWDFFPMERHY